MARVLQTTNSVTLTEKPEQFGECDGNQSKRTTQFVIVQMELSQFRETRERLWDVSCVTAHRQRDQNKNNHRHKFGRQTQPDRSTNTTIPPSNGTPVQLKRQTRQFVVGEPQPLQTRETAEFWWNFTLVTRQPPSQIIRTAISTTNNFQIHAHTHTEQTRQLVVGEVQRVQT